MKVDELVASYRKALIMHTYQEELVNQKLGNEISDAEIEQYYNQNTGAEANGKFCGFGLAAGEK